MVVRPTALSAMPISRTSPPSIHTAADAAAIAQSPARRSTFSCALPPPGRRAMRTSVSISPAPTAVMYGPMWNSSIGTIRTPWLPRITTRALTAVHTADRSSAASAWQSEPPIVPRLRTTGSAITRSASRKIGKCSASRSDLSRSTCRVSAPILISPPSIWMYDSSSSSSLMSTRYSGFASLSFIIGSRLWPPAITRASAPCFTSAAIAPSTLLARSYSNGAGVCIPLGPLPNGQPLARLPDVLTLLVLDRRTRSDHRGAGEGLGLRRPAFRVEVACREASALDVAKHGAGGVARRDRGLASEPRERERALGVDLADARPLCRPRLRILPEPVGGRAGVEALHQAHRVLHAGLLHKHPLEQLDPGIEILVDRVHDAVHRLRLLDDLAHARDHLVEALRDRAQLEDRRDEVVDEREHDQHDGDEHDRARC